MEAKGCCWFESSDTRLERAEAEDLADEDVCGNTSRHNSDHWSENRDLIYDVDAACVQCARSGEMKILICLHPMRALNA